ncbi:MAG TPA: HAMP domain-containing sensor histidine kinase [Candidatus Micrarchaeia archaeon]|nr:HAMP domain-containing sensor histidine kinase [Candidatus Micrarchaeia archaeon]
MRRRPHSSLRRHALRTAAVVTALVAVGLGAVLTATDLLVSHNLTGAVDQRLQESLGRVGAASGPPISEAAPRRDFDQPLFAWVKLPRGGCRAVGAAPVLPRGLCAVGSPTSADVAGNPFRLMGGRLPDAGRVVVGTSLAPVTGLLGGLVTAELVVGPLLLVLVFLGALAIGSRVAGPVERMRQRQLAFTADASHELRTPLTVIQADTNLALAGDDRSMRPALARVSGEVWRMRRIVEDLLWLARFDSQPEPPRPAILDLATAAQVAAERFATVAAARSVTVGVDAPDSVLLGSVPAEWMDRLIGVLVDNACRHARSRVSVSIRAREGRHVELSVLDDGEGVPETDVRRIFDRFHRATARGEGAGLGLAIADSVVRATRGCWEVTNLAGGGARFAVVWPSAKGEGSAITESARSRVLRWVARPFPHRQARPPVR